MAPKIKMGDRIKILGNSRFPLLDGWTGMVIGDHNFYGMYSYIVHLDRMYYSDYVGRMAVLINDYELEVIGREDKTRGGTVAVISPDPEDGFTPDLDKINGRI